MSVMLGQESDTFNTYEDLNEIKKIQLSNNLSVTLYEAGFNGISLKADKSLKTIIKFDMDNGELKLYTMTNNTLANKAKILVYIKNLKAIELFDKATIKSEKTINTDSLKINSIEGGSYFLSTKCKVFSLKSNGSSEGVLVVEADKVDIETYGSAVLEATMNSEEISIVQSDEAQALLKGKTKKLVATLNDRSLLKASALFSDDVLLNSYNTTVVNINAKNSIRINGQGNAKIYVSGKPKKRDTIRINNRTRIFY